MAIKSNNTLYLLSLLLFNVSFVLGDSEDSHDHDHDHDDEHDVHSCHYAYNAYLGSVLVEGECSYDTEENMSYMVECNSDTEAVAEVFSGTECDGIATSTTTITDSALFDCTTASECDVYEVMYYYYGNNSMNCDGTAEYSTLSVVTTGGDCVSNGNQVYIGFSIASDMQSFTFGYYSDDACTMVESGTTVQNSNVGCAMATDMGGYEMYTIELEEDEDSSANTFINLYKTFYISMAIVALVLYH